jgi:hypothetical protein
MTMRLPTSFSVALPIGRVSVLARWLMPMLAVPMAWAQPAPCSLLDAAALRAAAPRMAAGLGPMVADAPGTLGPAELPGLPATLTLAQCHAPVDRAGAVPIRLVLLAAPRALSVAEWQAVHRALDPDEPAPASAASCSRQAQPRKAGGQLLHEAGCGQTQGRWLVEISFESADVSQLPADTAIRSLLAAALARLP